MCLGAMVRAKGEVAQCQPPGSRVEGMSKAEPPAHAPQQKLILPLASSLAELSAPRADPPAFLPSTHCFNPSNYFMEPPHFTHSLVSPRDRPEKQVETLQRRHWKRKGR